MFFPFDTKYTSIQEDSYQVGLLTENESVFIIEAEEGVDKNAWCKALHALKYNEQGEFKGLNSKKMKASTAARMLFLSPLTIRKTQSCLLSMKSFLKMRKHLFQKN